MPQARFVFDNVIPKDEALKQLTSGGKVDIVTELTPAEAANVAKSKHAHVVEKQAKTVLMGVFNRDKKAWQDVALRRAVNTAVNQQQVLDEGYAGHGIVMPAMIKSGEFGYNASLGLYDVDRSAAKKALNGNGVKALTIVAGAGHIPAANSIAKQLKEAGVNATVKEGGPEGDWDIWLVEHFDWSPNYPQGVVIREFFGESGGFRKGPVDPVVGKLLAASVATPNTTEQAALAQELDARIHDQALGLFLYAPSKLYGVSNDVVFEAYETTVLELVDSYEIAR